MEYVREVAQMIINLTRKFYKKKVTYTFAPSPTEIDK